MKLWTSLALLQPAFVYLPPGYDDEPERLPERLPGRVLPWIDDRLVHER